MIKRKVGIRQTIGYICQSMGQEEVSRLTTVMSEAVDKCRQAMGLKQLLPALVDNRKIDDEEIRRAPTHARNPEYSAAVAKGERRENELRQGLFDAPAPGEVGAAADESDASKITWSVIEEAEDSELNASEIARRTI